jgi:hypothetical protein
MSTLEEIQDNVLHIMDEAQRNYLWGSNHKRLNTWHVSDFVSECLRKTQYSKTHPAKFDPSKAKIFWLGHVIHEALPLATSQEVENRPLDELGSVITGTLDDLIPLGNGEWVIADKKTYSGGGYYKKTAPDPSYRLQLDIYRVLLEATLGINAKYGCLLYLDKKADMAATPIAFDLTPIEETKVKMRNILKELQSGDATANPCWLCNGANKKKAIYCDYKDICMAEKPEVHPEPELKVTKIK